MLAVLGAAGLVNGAVDVAAWVGQCDVWVDPASGDVRLALGLGGAVSLACGSAERTYIPSLTRVTQIGSGRCSDPVRAACGDPNFVGVGDELKLVLVQAVTAAP